MSRVEKWSHEDPRFWRKVRPVTRSNRLYIFSSVFPQICSSVSWVCPRFNGITRSKSDVKAYTAKKKDLSKDAVTSVLGLVIECADLAHPAKPLKLHQRWSVMVTQEFFHQGSLEKEKGLDISPMCDRTVQEKDALAWARSQQGFIKFL